MGGSFYGGMTYAKSQTPARPTAGQFGAGRTGFARGGAAGGGAATGQIVTSDSTSMTIQLANSSSTQLVLLGNSTTIAKTVAGSSADLTPGTNVIVVGQANSDGSITAQSVQIRPAMPARQ